MAPELRAAVETAYGVFASYDLRGGLEVCRCNVCVAPQQEKLLATTPLRDIPATLLAEYTSSAHSWNERVADQLRYFLPRYFDLLALGDEPYDGNIGIEICLVRLGGADWRSSWARAELDAIDGFFTALLRAALRSPHPALAKSRGKASPDENSVEDLLCMMALAGADLPALLAQWDAADDLNAELWRASMIVGADWGTNQLHNLFWFGRERPQAEAGMATVVNWLRRPATRARLEAACLATADSDAAALLSQAEGIVGGSPL
jgi:hypothetical protein